jgi:hypothetical protein
MMTMRTAVKKPDLGLRDILGSLCLACVVVAGILVGSCHAQSDDPPAIPESAGYPDSEPTEMQAADSDASQPDEDFEAAQGPVNLDTGLPLNVLLTPFHVGRLSLLSFTVYEGYNSSLESGRIPLGSWVTAISGLTAYSTQFSGWRLDLQYQPFIWISPQRTFQDFAASSLDLRKIHQINRHWRWAANERLRYAPTNSTAEERGFVAAAGGGFTIGNAFLSSGRNVFLNAAAFTLTDRYTEKSSLVFHANQDYTHLSNYLGSSSVSLPSEQAITYSAGVTWRDQFSLRNTLILKYDFRAQVATSNENVDFHTVSIGLSHKLKPTLGVSVTFGPGWSVYGGSQNDNASSGTRTTLHGSIDLAKEFTRGGLVLSASRSDSFSGIISNSFHNRYDVTAHRQITPRLHASVTASYIQQQFSSQRDTNGELVTGEARYFVTRNWATFSQVRYLNIVGSERILAPEKSVIVGVRWAWVPEKP